ncbi:fatty acid desaturase [Methylosarcina fibrata]|uniref:fatty acid desaturase n=1 Tax=Methylosarcina fibrata TaxID=105972 RepID=UPI00036AEE87|nr:fatty acid desaturase [Methylosarcina fibrata]
MPHQSLLHKTLPSIDSSLAQISRQELIQTVSRFAEPDNRKALFQIANTLLPYLGLWALMIVTVVQGFSYWFTLLLAAAAAGFLVRTFILFHDCCHSSFFSSRLANKIFGNITGILTFTSFEDWKRTHIIHHSAAGNLDRRGIGDIWTLTVEEYLSSSRLKRLIYRLFRNPLVLFVFIPPFLFLIMQRFTSLKAGKRERFNIVITNLAILSIVLLMSLTLGFWNYLIIQLPVIFMAASMGMWLFYVQHQYEDVYWARQPDWDLTKSGLEGSSYYKLPAVLQWIVGNIGLHHIHHVRANIPNYHLQRCYDEVPALQAVTPLTIRSSLKSLWLNLWDEQRQKLVSFRSIRWMQRHRAETAGI